MSNLSMKYHSIQDEYYEYYWLRITFFVFLENFRFNSQNGN